MSKMEDIHPEKTMEELKGIANTSISSSSLGIFDIFKGNDIFKVKSFQRKYAWTENQVNDLIEDLLKYNENKHFFIGTIIVKKSKNMGQVEFSIVDGQQRITTLFLMLKAIEITIREKFKIENFVNFESINRLYLFKTSGQERLKLEGYRKNTKELEKILKCMFTSDIEKILKENNKMSVYIQNIKYVLGHQALKSEEQLKLLLNRIKMISFSVIMLGEEIDENKVFEDLNSKGSPLLIEDLIRNYFYTKTKGILKNNTSDSLEEIESKTNTIIDQYEISLEKLETFLIEDHQKYRGLFSKKINRFFKNFILYKINNVSKLDEENNRRMFIQFKNENQNKVTEILDVKNELHSIEKYFKFCIYMSQYNNDLEHKDAIINNAKYLINTLEFYPLIFAFYSKWEEKYHNAIIFFSAIIYINLSVKEIKIWDFLKENLNSIKSKILDNSKDKKQILEELLKDILYPKQQESQAKYEFKFWDIFKDDLKNKISDNSDVFSNIGTRRLIQYYFASQNKSTQIHLVDKKFNFEHIIPQNINSEDMINVESLMLFTRVNRIENLVLVEKKINSKFDNLTFEKKIDIYKEYFLDEGLASQIDEVNKIFKNENKNKLNQILNERKSEQINYVDTFVDFLKKKWKEILDRIK